MVQDGAALGSNEGGCVIDKPCCICQKANGRYRLSQNLEATMCYDGPQYSLWVCGDRCLRGAVTVVVALTGLGPEIDFGLEEEDA